MGNDHHSREGGTLPCSVIPAKHAPGLNRGRESRGNTTVSRRNLRRAHSSECEDIIPKVVPSQDLGVIFVQSTPAKALPRLEASSSRIPRLFRPANPVPRAPLDCARPFPHSYRICPSNSRFAISAWTLWDTRDADARNNRARKSPFSI